MLMKINNLFDIGKVYEYLVDQALKLFPRPLVVIRIGKEKTLKIRVKNEKGAKSVMNILRDNAGQKEIVKID